MQQRASTITAAAILAAAFISAPLSAQARPMALRDIPNIVGITSPQISPDGSSIVAVISRVNFKDDKIEHELDLIDVATHAHRALTYKRAGVGDPQWAPTGDRLAFTALVGTGPHAKSQVFVMRMDGGDAVPVTSAPEGIGQYVWRPDGKAIAYAAIDALPKKKGADRFRDAFDVGDAGITAHAAAEPVHVWLEDLASGKARKLTTGAPSVATGEATSSLSFSHDGTELAFVLAPNAVLNDVVQGHIAVLDIANGKLSAATGNTGFESDPLFAPTGTKLAYTHSSGDNQSNLNEAFVTLPGSGAHTPVSHDFDRAVHGIAWQPDGSGIFFTVNDGTQAALVRAPLGAAPRRIDLGAISIASPLVGAIARDGALAFVGSAPTEPPEIYYRGPHGKPERLTDYNASIAALHFGTSETIAFPSSLGVQGDGVLIKPPGFLPGKKYPLVLIIHGGPTSASTTAFDRYGQLAAAHGWLVLEPNYRGSDNLGLAYQRGVLYDPEAGPGKDIAAAIDAVKAMGIVDEQRIAVSGWSYGGIMTAWMITHYHFFRAAVSGASVNDWVTDYTVADDMESDVALFHGSPFVGSNRAEWERASADTYAKDVTTPTLILSDSGDNRDPSATSYSFFRALKDNHKDVTFVAYPVNGHFPRDPVRSLDVWTRWFDYIAKHF